MTPDAADNGSLGAGPRGSGHRASAHDAVPDCGSAALIRAMRGVKDLTRSARTADLFDRLAARYDAWYDKPAGAAVFAAELACLQPLLAGLPRPWAEVGVGSGRFAAALGAEVGVDPAAGPLALPPPAAFTCSAAPANGCPSAPVCSAQW